MTWSQTLLQASFKGATFEVERTADQGARAVAVNEYPYRDGADVEDLGLQARRLRFTAIVWEGSPSTDDYKARLDALISALNGAGAGELVHPVFGTCTAMCTGWSIDHEAEFRDGCVLQLEFMESRSAERVFATGSPIAEIDAIGTQADTARSAADEGLFARIAQVLKQPVPLQLAQRVQMQSALSKLQALVDTTALKQRLSELDPLFYPQAYVADARNVLDRALQGLPFGGRNILFGGSSSSASASTSSAGSSGLNDFERAARALSPAATALTAPNNDGLAVQAHARVYAGCCLAEAAGIVLAGELDEPLLDLPDVERLAVTTRTAIQAALEDLRASAGPDNAGAVAASSAALRAVAYRVDEAARAVIELRPPVMRYASPVTGPLRLVAHALYGDHERAAELLRLNAWGKRLVVQHGEEIKAYAR